MAGLPLRSAIARGGDEWTPQETLNLLEELEQGDRSWDEVGAALGKPAELCIAHFLSLPIEEPYSLEALPGAPPPSSDADGGADGSSEAAGGGGAPTDPMACQLAIVALALRQPAAAAGSSSAPAAGAAANKAADAAAAGLRAAAREFADALRARAVQAEAEATDEMRTLVGAAVDTQCRRLELKLAMLEEMGALLHKERDQLDRVRQQV